VEQKGTKGVFTDVYEIADLPDLRAGKHTAEATVKREDGGAETKVVYEFESP
jgi:hypothetical protein